MRTTLHIEEDIMAAVKEVSKSRRISQGQVISRLLRKALTGSLSSEQPSAPKASGFKPFPARGIGVSDELIDKLPDSEGV